MTVADKILYRISPAYFISKCGRDFTLDDACTDSAVSIDHFITHYLREYSSDVNSLVAEDRAANHFGETLPVMQEAYRCDRVIIPITPFAMGSGGENDRRSVSGDGHDAEFERWIVRPLSLAEEHGVFADIGIHADSISSSLDRLADFLRRHRGRNVDTTSMAGHANAMHEVLMGLQSLFSTYLWGSHLRDNLGTENLLPRSGGGNIDWLAVVRGLPQNGIGGLIDNRDLVPIGRR